VPARAAGPDSAFVATIPAPEGPPDATAIVAPGPDELQRGHVRQVAEGGDELEGAAEGGDAAVEDVLAGLSWIS